MQILYPFHADFNIEKLRKYAFVVAQSVLNAPQQPLFTFYAKKQEVNHMAVFRVEKTRDYTIMSNYHLKEKKLTLKAKGLLSVILSLLDGWNYTSRGPAAICKEGVDSIGAALQVQIICLEAL